MLLTNPCDLSFWRRDNVSSATRSSRDLTLLGIVATAWPVILFNYNLPPDLRTHLDHILCYGIIPGPKPPKDVDSFLIPLYNKLAQLSKGVDGTLDLSVEEFFVLRAYLILLFGDMPAISKLLMMKGHNGHCPCRYCEGGAGSWRKGKLFPSSSRGCSPHPTFPAVSPSSSIHQSSEADRCSRNGR